MTRMTNALRSACCVLAVVCAACSSPNPSASVPALSRTEDTLTIALGAQATTSDGGLRLRYVQLVNESRCPANVVCVWEGDAAVKLSGVVKRAAIEATIHTGLEPRSMQVSGYQLSLLDVRPYPGAKDSTQAKRVVVRVVLPPR